MVRISESGSTAFQDASSMGSAGSKAQRAPAQRWIDIPTAAIPAYQSPETLTPAMRRSLTAAVAHELHKIHGGNDVLDWLEAEILVQGVLERGAQGGDGITTQ